MANQVAAALFVYQSKPDSPANRQQRTDHRVEASPVCHRVTTQLRVSPANARYPILARRAPLDRGGWARDAPAPTAVTVAPAPPHLRHPAAVVRASLRGGERLLDAAQALHAVVAHADGARLLARVHVLKCLPLVLHHFARRGLRALRARRRRTRQAGFIGPVRKAGARQCCAGRHLPGRHSLRSTARWGCMAARGAS